VALGANVRTCYRDLDLSGVPCVLDDVDAMTPDLAMAVNTDCASWVRVVAAMQWGFPTLHALGNQTR
jgi:hypothetical protein